MLNLYVCGKYRSVSLCRILTMMFLHGRTRYSSWIQDSKAMSVVSPGIGIPKVIQQKSFLPRLSFDFCQ